ncbi:oxidative stress defense protein [Vibrio sonorensis]|uniref:oxidative stress defense protein n=1 Tax=Vibrio sonorensis TaxID=1004316 RepID=UPI0008DA891D|nr:oxidative stress defense protein [Vibrio sonorensis]
MKKLSTLLLATACVSSFSTFAAQPEFPHIVTTGFGEVTAKPDMAKFSVRVVETTLTAEQAKQAVDKVVSDFLTKLNNAGVAREDILSSNLYLAPQYHYPKNGKSELVGYRASRNITVTVHDLPDLNTYLDVALEHGINQVDNIQLLVSDQKGFKEKARTAAIADAKQKAEALAKGFDKQLDGVWRIDYDASSAQPVMMRSMAMDAKLESSGYQDSSLVIRDQVHVIYKLTN